MRKHFMETFCGNILWKHFAETFVGKHFCRETFCGSILWKHFAETFCGETYVEKHFVGKHFVEKHFVGKRFVRAPIIHQSIYLTSFWLISFVPIQKNNCLQQHEQILLNNWFRVKLVSSEYIIFIYQYLSIWFSINVFKNVRIVSLIVSQ